MTLECIENQYIYQLLSRATIQLYNRLALKWLAIIIHYTKYIFTIVTVVLHLIAPYCL